ncbi:unnamed protein product [Hydatigera taeniaeformis]|uniref:DUF5597 domain-containing protein n=1 Tax=Hydatigena taeniaeformis TaxID=6205 RepID=A0A0R3WID9_HYDTA|nr:unnamed protein product [Hydatigera taeniaeformis]
MSWCWVATTIGIVYSLSTFVQGTSSFVIDMPRLQPDPSQPTMQTPSFYRFVFSSQLRFLWAKEEEGGPWKLQGTPSPHGLTVKLRQRSLPQLHSSPTSASDDVDDSIQSSTLDESDLIRRTATQIGLLRFERVMRASNRPPQSVVESFTHLPTSLPHIGDVEDDHEVKDAEEPNVIKVRVASIDWSKGMANTTRLPDDTGRLVRLPIPETLPNPNSMHIFVQFQVSNV